MASDLAIICTFGVVSPYLAALVCISTCCSVVQWRVVIVRYLYRMTELSMKKEALSELKSTFEGLGNDFSFVHIWILIVTVSTLLVYLLMADMMGDSNQVLYYYFIVALAACVLIVSGLYWSLHYFLGKAKSDFLIFTGNLSEKEIFN